MTMTPSTQSPSCLFCFENATPKIIQRLNSVFAIPDAYPVTPGHVLVIPIRHESDYLLLTEAEKKDANLLIDQLCKHIKQTDRSVTGFNIGINIGADAGQTIWHAHIHVIPRRSFDTPAPRGGVRGVIPDKMAYPSMTDIK